MKMNRWLMLPVVAMMLGSAWAQGPNNSGTYYANANGKSGAALRTALGNIINPHTNIGYKGLFDAYRKTDKRADGKVRDWYSNTTNYDFDDHTGGYSKEGDMYNREHSVPQSWFGSSNVIVSDIVHVIPTDGYVNNRRGNNPLAEVLTVSYQSNNGYSKLGSCKTEGFNGVVFEPNDEIKGDMARIYFYMATCYESACADWGNVFSSSNNGFESWYIDMLMRWAKQDPIDDVEIARNNAVYEVQGNRNPYVDYPGLEEYIWGDLTTQPFSYDNYGSSVTTYVAMPVFTPDAGTYYNQVEVTISCSTPDAVIYYTTDGADASEQSIRYEAPFTLTETSTIKAIAIKDDGRSAQAEATYTVTDVDPLDGMIALNSQFFNCSYTGSMGSTAGDLNGESGPINVVYSLGTGSNRYCSADHIRLYQGNTLTVSTGQGSMTAVEFVTKNSGKSLFANNEAVDGYTWTGNSTSLVFNVDGGSGNLQVSGIKVTVNTPSGIEQLVLGDVLSGRRVVYNLRGQRVTHPTRGLYIVDGKKVFIE